MTNQSTFPVIIEVSNLQIKPAQLVPKIQMEGDPVVERAPLVTAENYTLDGHVHLKVEIVVFSSSIYSEPIIGVTNNNSFFYIQEGPKLETTVLTQVPYNIYYFGFVLKTDYLVNEIMVFNNFSDPKTSRGTVTTVQSTTPPITPPQPILTV